MRAKLMFGLVVGLVITSLCIVGYTPQVQAATSKKTEILFGGSLGISGKFAETGRLIEQGMKLWFEETNAAGGIYVKEYGAKLPVRWIFYDDNSDPATGAKLYEKLITHDKVDFVTLPYSSGIVFAATTVTEKYQKVGISHTGSSDKIFTRGFDYCFNHIGLASHHLDGVADLLKNLEPRPKTIAMAVIQELYTLTVAETFRKTVQDMGFEVVLYDEIPSEIKDASSVIHKMKALEPDVFVGLTRSPSAALFGKQMKALDFRPKLIYMNEGPEMQWYLDEFGEDAEGIVSRFLSYANPKDPMIIDFTKRIEAMGVSFNPIYHAHPYDCLEIIRQAIEATGTLDNTKIAEYIRTHEIPGMLMGKDHKANFKGFGDYNGVNVNLSPVATQVQNGKIVVLWPEWCQEAKPWYPLEPWKK